jgi:hypothetical protein
MSDSGSEAGAADCAQVHPGAVIIAQPRLLTCENVGYLAACPAVYSVVVLGVVGSSPIVHPTH